MARESTGHIERLASGSYRVSVYAGTDPLTRRPIRLRTTARTETQARIELGKLLEKARDGRSPEAGVTVARLLDEYAQIARWDVSTRRTNEGFIQRTIKPAIGHLKIRQVNGEILDKLYARLMRCRDLSCSGHAFIEHRHMPVLKIDPADTRPAWKQVAAALREAITSGVLLPGDEMPSITEASRLQGIGTGVIRHALEALTADGLIVARRNQTAIVAGEPPDQPPSTRRRPGPGHDCRRAGCQAHVCRPMKPSTIHGIDGILSGAFAMAQRWEWIDRNPTDSAKPPAVNTRKSIPATPPEDVAKVITEARAHSTALGLYLWIVVITGARRGELCGLQIRDIDLDQGLIHVAFNYVVKGGKKIRKDTKTHQDRWLAIDPDTCALISSYLGEVRATLAAVGVEVAADAYLFSNGPGHTRPWNPDWATHQISAAADAVGVDLDIKGGRHYTASQLLAAGFDRRNTAARLGHSGGGATTLRHYADPVPEADRRAATYLSRLTSNAAAATETRRQQQLIPPGGANPTG
jgi:integrase/DNA-binding transcriptional regulator YhcF (GntR family)